MRYKLFFLSVSMFVVISESEAQTEQYCVHYPYNTQVGINLNVNMLSKMRVEPLSDMFCSYPNFGINWGAYLYQRIYKWFGIQIGIEQNLFSNVRYGTTAFNDDMSVYTELSLLPAFAFPILFNASYYFNEKHGIDIALGGYPLVFYIKDAWYGHLVEFRLPESHCNFRLEGVTRFDISLYGKIGYNFLFKNKNTLGVSIIGSYTAEPYAKGHYSVSKKGISESGNTSIRNTSVGLQFSYGFTMKKLVCNPVNN